MIFFQSTGGPQEPIVAANKSTELKFNEANALITFAGSYICLQMCHLGENNPFIFSAVWLGMPVSLFGIRSLKKSL